MATTPEELIPDKTSASGARREKWNGKPPLNEMCAGKWPFEAMVPE
jgi:hypothetical protein